MVKAIVGANWGDEGKGRMVDYLTDHYDVVVRYQGGGNAGHTVVNEKGKFELNKTGLLAYSHGEYLGLGKKIGTFGYSVKKKADRRRKRGKK